MYDAKKGSFVDIGILDVLQIFGRAGRPQFDKQGEGIIITSHDKLSHYLALLTRQSPIESQFISSLTDSLNAEVRNRPFPSCFEPRYKSEAKCKVFVMKISFHSYANKTHFHLKSFALSLAFIVRFTVTWQWPICVD